MYSVIEQIINHTWQSNYSGDQQYIYYIISVLIPVFSVTFIDLFYRFINSILRKGGKS